MSDKPSLGLAWFTYAQLVEMELQWHPNDPNSPILRAIKMEINNRDQEFHDLQANASAVMNRRKIHHRW